MKEFNVVSCFDGHSCGQIALKELKIPIKNYYSFEVDKFAIEQTQSVFPNTIQLGDIENWKNADIDWSGVDLFIGGSPCQGFSFAGKQLNFKDPRSKLFFVFVDILNHIKTINPNIKFLLENVNMKKEHQNVINKYLGIFSVRINSNRVSAQNRDRLYWSNIRTKQKGFFFTYTDIPQPKDRGILLKDILQPESEVDEKYYIKNPKMLKFITDEWRLNKRYTQIDGAKALPQMARQYTSWCGDYLCVAMRGGYSENPSDRKTDSPTEQRLEPKTNGKTNCLTSVSKDNLILQINPSKESGGKQPYQQNRVYNSNGILPGLCAHKADLIIKNGYILRRLTPLECARLQTVPSWYKWIVSDSQIYKMLGNGWTVEAIKHILKYLKLNNE